jgi:hypothetical protein
MAFSRKTARIPSLLLFSNMDQAESGLAQPVTQITQPVTLFFFLARSARKIDLEKTRLPKFCPGGLISGKRKKNIGQI